MAEEKIDESLYSRQLYVMGHDAQRRMANSSVLIVGMNGLGVEVAKNVILAGVKSVALYDKKAASWEDLASNFYISESELGKPRAALCAPKLAELNPYVPIKVVEGELTTTTIAEYKVVVLIDVPLKKQLELSTYCHANDICVIVTDVMGVFGGIFCDFGKNFVCYDTNGEPNASSMVANITNDNPCIVTCLEDHRHHLETGDTVTMTDIHGMEGLNGQEFGVTVKDGFSFEIAIDTTQMGKYDRGGYINQVKKPTTVSFSDMATTIADPGMYVADWCKLTQASVLHLAFQGIHQFRDSHGGEYPQAGHPGNAQEVYEFTLAINDALPEGSSAKMPTDGEEGLNSHEKYIKRVAMCARGLVSPICAAIGGIAGQEVLKACSGKFMPIKQWFYYDAIESLPDEPLSQDEVTPQGCRYDGQLMVFGKSMQAQLGALKLFVVGAGAIGCEMVKNLAMMGVSCEAGKGMTYITDMDQIEKSNLSRQFLFRSTDINKPKSTTAVSAVTRMNPAFQSTAFENKVAPDTESIFNDEFMDNLDLVFTALDNVEARLYVDQRCVLYKKPMLESGTLGTKGSTQVVVPGITEHYGARRDPPEKSIAICTLKHFPNLIEHTLAWGRDWFEEAYKQAPDDANSYLTSDDFESTLANQQNMKLEALNRIKEALLDKPAEFNDCVAWARLKFEDLFCNKIKQLLHNFPLDKTISVQGGSGVVPFWSGAKKPPSPVQFDSADPLHLEFVKSAANLRAKSYGIVGSWEDQIVTEIVSAISVPEFKPVDGVTIPSNDEEAKNNSGAGATSSYMDVDGQCEQMLKALPPRSAFNSSFLVQPQDFEKDDDEHMRVIAACSNLRARNYSIPEVDLHKSRGIAGKITPAIATTTALVTGQICIELFKVLLNKPIEKFQCSFSNLALPLFTHEEPAPPVGTVATIKGKEWKWTVWDRIEIDEPDMTLQALIDYMEQEYGLELSMVSAGVSILYTDYMAKKKAAERKPMTLKAVTELVTKKSVVEGQKFLVLELLAQDLETDEEVDLPSLRCRLF